MRESIDLEGYGKVHLRPPHSLVAINDVVAEWSGNGKNRAKLARLSAAVVGICWADNNRRNCPVYDLESGEIISYGGTVLEWMIGRGVVLPSLYAAASPLFHEVWAFMPKAKEVEKATAGFPDGAGENGTPDLEDRPSVGT